MKTLLIIGGGITGLSTAYYSLKMFREKGIEVRCIVVEADSQFGGKVQTWRKDGFVIELGPDSFLARKRAALDLIQELELEDELVGMNPRSRKTYILHRGKLHRMPQGLNIGVPTQFLPFAKTKLLSWPGKLRAGLDFFLPKGQPIDQSLGEFLERRLGKEVVTFLAEPILAGIYAGDLYSISLQATFPQFQTLEQKHGSVIRGMIAQSQEAKQMARSKSGESTTVGRKLPDSLFLTLRNGLSSLIEKLVEELSCNKETELKTGRKAVSMSRLPDNRYRIQFDDNSVLEADTVILTTPAFETARLVESIGRSEAQFDESSAAHDARVLTDDLEQVPYVSVATVVLAFSKDQIESELDASGFVVPRTEGRTITACTWTSMKWLHTAPNDKVLIRCYVGRSGEEEIVNETDENIIEHVRKDLKDILQIHAEPLFTRVTRWKQAMPQYRVGHLDRVRKFTDQVSKAYPGVFAAGAAFEGVGLPDCIAQGKQIAGQIVSSTDLQPATARS